MKNGFSLVELLVVLSVIGILLTAALPVFNQTQRMAALNSSAQLLASDLRLAQAKALASRFPHRLFCQGAGYAITRENVLSQTRERVKTATLPLGLSFKDERAVEFSSSGFPRAGTSGTLIIQNQSGRAKKVIVSSLGRVRIE